MKRSLQRTLVLALLLLAGCRQLRGGVVELSCSPARLQALQCEKIALRVSLRNGSGQVLSQARRFFLSFHAYDASGRQIAFDNPRFALPRPVRPGESLVFTVPAYFNLPAGALIIEWELVKEGEYWGRDKGWPSFFQDVRLQPLVSPAFRETWLPTFYESGRDWLDRGQYLLRQTLRNNEAKKDGRFFAFSAGSDYPQAWIRDTATLMAYARFFYPSGQLQDVVGLFLRRQGPTGEIADWVDAAGRSGKNTVESDQESSLLLAAYHLALDDPGWLRRDIDGLSVFARLEKALQWLWQNRFDAQAGLLWSGFTADWGDVERSYADERATRLSDRSRRAYAIYTQALFLQAAQRLTAMADWLAEGPCAQRWRSRAETIAKNCRARLYLPDQGYFLVHLLAGRQDLLALEKGILAVGGNAEAMRAGLFSRKEIERLLTVLEKRRGEFGLRSVSYTLLPPYPEGFFPHPLLSPPWSYQNGGEWDWIGGRLVCALYQNGLRRQAENYLREIIERSLARGNIFEWSDRGGNGQGASFYAGAAGVLGEAILLGHFALGEDFDRYVFPHFADPFRLAVSKAGDRFQIGRSAMLSLNIAALAKKEICITAKGGKKRTCIAKKGQTAVP
jgi:hypothetical protein